MKKLLLLAAMVLLVLGVRIAVACGPADCPNECVCGLYVDEDGDGICDLCDGCIPVPQGDDDDGDGIPNGQDDDYVPPLDGAGSQKGK